MMLPLWPLGQLPCCMPYSALAPLWPLLHLPQHLLHRCLATYLIVYIATCFIARLITCLTSQQPWHMHSISSQWLGASVVIIVLHRLHLEDSCVLLRPRSNQQIHTHSGRADVAWTPSKPVPPPTSPPSISDKKFQIQSIFYDPGSGSASISLFPFSSRLLPTCSLPLAPSLVSLSISACTACMYMRIHPPNPS